MKTALSLLMCFILVGCDSNAAMRKRFPSGKVRIMTDEAGNKYVVQHHGGDTYTVRPYEPDAP